MHMFWDFWGVVVLDRSMKVVRRGSVGLASDRNPCRLFEIRSDNAAIPAAHRGEWLLSVQWQDPPVSTMPSPDHDEVDSASDDSPTDSLNPVHWDTDPPSENPSQWKEVRPPEIRSAETAGFGRVFAEPTPR